MLCDLSGTVEEVLKFDVETDEPVIVGDSLSTIVVEGDKPKYALFHTALLDSPCGLDWLISIETKPDPDVFRFAGCRVKDQLLVIAADAREDATRVLETFADVNNELLTQVRVLAKAQAQTQAHAQMGVPQAEHSSLYEEMSRLNNELANLQRELSQKNRLLENARDGLETDVAIRTAELSRTVDELARAIRAKDDFFAQMSHELRTPLNSVIGFSGVLLLGIAGQLNEEQERQVRMINNAGREQLALIDDILVLSKAASEAIDLHPTEYDIGELVLEVMKEVTPLIKQSDLDLHFECDENMPQAFSDRTIAHRILLSLITNAVKFSGSGQIQVHARHVNEEFALHIVDSGPGIPLDEQDSVFKPFAQGSTADPNRTSGSGLGLAISRELARQIGGSLSILRSDASGSEFVFRAPLHLEESA